MSASKEHTLSRTDWLGRFWSKVNKTSTCWFWTAGLFGDGYPAFWLNGHTDRAHRLSWMLANPGQVVPAGLVVRHTCDVPACVRPDHLTLGTSKDNSQDMVQRGRSSTGDRNGSRIYPERILRGEDAPAWRPGECRNGHDPSRRYISASGERVCTDCAVGRVRRYRAKVKARRAA